MLHIWQHKKHTDRVAKSQFHWESHSGAVSLQRYCFISIFCEMEFFDNSDSSHSESDISDSEDEISGQYQSEREEDIILRDGLQKSLLPRKNEWIFESFSKRSSEYIGSQKSTIDSKYDSFRIGYNSFDTILLNKAKSEIQHILSLVRKSIYLRDKKQPLTPFSCFAAICPDQYFLSFRQWLIEGLGQKILKDDTCHFNLSEIVTFFYVSW